MMAVAMLALFAASGAQPELFGLVPVDSITSPPDERGEVAWSMADMPWTDGWEPTTYDGDIIRVVFGEPARLAPDVQGWAFAHQDATEFGVVLVPRTDGTVVPHLWEWGILHPIATFRGLRLARRAGSAWLNALAEFQREVRGDPPVERPKPAPAPPAPIDPRDFGPPLWGHSSPEALRMHTLRTMYAAAADPTGPASPFVVLSAEAEARAACDAIFAERAAAQWREVAPWLGSDDDMPDIDDRLDDFVPEPPDPAEVAACFERELARVHTERARDPTRSDPVRVARRTVLSMARADATDFGLRVVADVGAAPGPGVTIEGGPSPAMMAALYGAPRAIGGALRGWALAVDDGGAERGVCVVEDGPALRLAPWGEGADAALGSARRWLSAVADFERGVAQADPR